MGNPDVVGHRLEKAIALLKAGGVEKINIIPTASPRMRAAGYDGSARVVRQSTADDGTMELLVCNMNENK